MAGPQSLYRYVYLTLPYNGGAPDKIDVVFMSHFAGDRGYSCGLLFELSGGAYQLVHQVSELSLASFPDAQCVYNVSDEQVIISLGLVDIATNVTRISMHYVRFYG